MEYNNMVDVMNIESFDIFPTTITSFSLKINHKPMLDKLIYTDDESLRSNDQLHKEKTWGPLVDGIHEVTDVVLKTHQYEFDSLEITGMWANRLDKGEAHPPHTHSNNFLSGVYYLKAGETSPIQFFDPRPAANVLQPRNSPNWHNSSMVQFNSVEGVGYIFPSWLQHWVPPTKEHRVSISWNILLRGHYGEPGTLQNAYI